MRKDTTNMDALRRSAGISRTQSVRNDDVLWQMELEDTVQPWYLLETTDMAWPSRYCPNKPWHGERDGNKNNKIRKLDRRRKKSNECTQPSRRPKWRQETGEKINRTMSSNVLNRLTGLAETRKLGVLLRTLHRVKRQSEEGICVLPKRYNAPFTAANNNAKFWHYIYAYIYLIRL